MYEFDASAPSTTLQLDRTLARAPGVAGGSAWGMLGTVQQRSHSVGLSLVGLVAGARALNAGPAGALAFGLGGVVAAAFARPGVLAGAQMLAGVGNTRLRRRLCPAWT